MSQNGQYKLKDYPRKRGGERGGKKKERTFVSSVSCLGNLYERRPLRIWIPASSDSKSMQLHDTSSHIIIFKIRISHCQIHLGPVLRHTLYKFIVLGSLGQETVQFGLGSKNRDPTLGLILLQKKFYFKFSHSRSSTCLNVAPQTSIYIKCLERNYKDYAILIINKK